MKALDVVGLKKSFGGVKAVNELSFSVEEYETVGIIGPNGAGKTTLFNLITGLYKPDGGKVTFFGQDLDERGAAIGWPISAYRGHFRT